MHIYCVYLLFDQEPGCKWFHVPLIDTYTDIWKPGIAGEPGVSVTSQIPSTVRLHPSPPAGCDPGWGWTFLEEEGNNFGTGGSSAGYSAFLA